MPRFLGGGPTRRRRPVAVICAAVVATLVVAPTAAAHVGIPTTVVTAGPYRVVIKAGPVSAGSHQAALAFRAAITDRATHRPAADASLRLVVAPRSGGPGVVRRVGGFDGVYSLLVPIRNPDTWRSLRFTLRIAGPLGSVTARYVPPDLFDEWPFEAVPVALAALAGVLFLQGFVRLRRRGRADRAPWSRAALFALGLAAMVLPLVSPLDPVADHYLLSAHMLEHVLLGDVGPALLVVAVRGPLVFFALPPAILRVVGHAAWLRRTAAWLQRPRTVVGVWALAYLGWHVPVAYDYAAAHQWAHDLEHASFVFAGVLLWTLLVDPAGRGELSRGRRLAVAASVFAIGTVIADTFIFSLHPLYPAYAAQVERVFSLTPVHDQQIAGLVMMVDQILTLGTFAVLLLLPEVRARRGRSRVLAPSERLA